MARFWHPKLMCCKVRVVLKEGVFKTEVVPNQTLQAREFLRDVGVGGQEGGLELIPVFTVIPFPPPPRAQLTL